MKKCKIDAYSILERIRSQKPIVHHLTNWVTIYDCANIVKVLGGSPVMAHAKEEAAQMVGIASSLVLNIGTLTPEFVEAMKIAAKAANKKKIPVVLDVCGAGATDLRDKKSFELIEETRIDIIKGNASEIARIAGEDVSTKGVDAASVDLDMHEAARRLALRTRSVVVVTGEVDIVTCGVTTYAVENGHPLMSSLVGTGCMAASVIGACAAVERDLALAATAGLVCFEIASELAAKSSRGPASFKESMFDHLYQMGKEPLNKLQRVQCE
ncbi:MAG: hydroxyethylthiazole kinase [Candidatus Omnitrophota bacterium]